MGSPAAGGLDQFVQVVREQLAPQAEKWSQAGAVPAEVAATIAGTGVLGACVQGQAGIVSWSYRDYGEANRVLAAVSASAQSLLTVHGMVCQALSRWASAGVRSWLPELAGGSAIGAFALTEHDTGSDIRRLSTSAVQVPEGWRLHGSKRWVSFGRIAEVFLVFATTAAGDAAFAVRRRDPGVRIHSETPVSGLAAAQLGRVELAGCTIPSDRLVGRPGFGLSQVGVRALTLGRACVAFGAVGLAEACRDATLQTVNTRHRFGQPLRDFQLVRGLLSDCEVALEGARLLAQRAADSLDTNSRQAVAEVLVAKLAASRAATQAASVSSQIHGADGLADDGAVERRVRDARALEIIEGNTQLLQHLIAEQLVASWRAARHDRSGS